MGKILIVLSYLIGCAAFASNGYELNMELSMNGKKAFSPKITVMQGEPGIVTHDTSTKKTFIEVVAKEGQIQSHKGILMNFVVGYIEQDGTRTILSKPEILAKEDQKAQISVGDKDGKENISLSVVAKRRSF